MVLRLFSSRLVLFVLAANPPFCGLHTTKAVLKAVKAVKAVDLAKIKRIRQQEFPF